jgi:Zn-dependent protease with chaperone function
MARSSSGLAGLLRPLLALYVPFMLLLCVILLTFAAGLVAFHVSTGFWIFLLLAILVVLPIGHVIWALFTVLRLTIPEDELELRLPRDTLSGLYEFVAEVARERDCPAPDEILIVPDRVAAAREGEDGRHVLILGGLALATFTQPALAGVVAHELAHFRAGDTRLSRAAWRRHVLMDLLEYRIHAQPGTKLNPMIWLLLGYHRLYALAWSADSREREYAADRYTVDHVGKEQAAAALMLITLTERLPWVRLSNIAQNVVETNLPVDQIFSEQRLRAKNIGRSEWEEACEKELRRPTEALDSHPALKQRLKAIKVSPKNALIYALDQPGPPARDLVAAWPGIEKMLTQRLVALYRAAHLAKLEFAQIVLGRAR